MRLIVGEREGVGGFDRVRLGVGAGVRDRESDSVGDTVKETPSTIATAQKVAKMVK